MTSWNPHFSLSIPSDSRSGASTQTRHGRPSERAHWRHHVQCGELPCTPKVLISNDPYCLVDPVCVSPIYRGDSGANVPEWQGSETYLNDPTLGSHNSYRAFALLNWALFNLLVGAALAATLVAPSHMGPTIWAGVITWYVLEWLRWSHTVWVLTGKYS